jgi:hypothetical protein
MPSKLPENSPLNDPRVAKALVQLMRTAADSVPKKTGSRPPKLWGKWLPKITVGIVAVAVFGALIDWLTALPNYVLAGLIVGFPLGLVVGGLLEYTRDKPEERVRNAHVASEMRHLRWMVAELEAGHTLPPEHLVNNRSAIELDRFIEETSRRWAANKEP